MMERGYRSRMHRVLGCAVRWGRSSDGTWTTHGEPVGFVGTGITRRDGLCIRWINVGEFGLWIGWRALPDDVVKLVKIARHVAFSDHSEEALRMLDAASEAFADRVPWDDEPKLAENGN